MMTFEQVAVMLDILCTNYKIQPAGEPEIDIWHGQLRNFDSDRAMQTAEKIVAEENFFPTIAKFRDIYAALVPPDMKQLGATERNEDCEFCHGALWGEVSPLVAEEDVSGRTYEQWEPCQSCNPSGFERWIETRKPPLKPRREELYEANPRRWIETARDAIKDTSDL